MKFTTIASCTYRAHGPRLVYSVFSLMTCGQRLVWKHQTWRPDLLWRWIPVLYMSLSQAAVSSPYNGVVGGMPISSIVSSMLWLMVKASFSVVTWHRPAAQVHTWLFPSSLMPQSIGTEAIFFLLHTTSAGSLQPKELASPALSLLFPCC